MLRPGGWGGRVGHDHTPQNQPTTNSTVRTVQQLHVQHGGVVAGQRDGPRVRYGRHVGRLIGVVDGEALQHGVLGQRDERGAVRVAAAATRQQHGAVVGERGALVNLVRRHGGVHAQQRGGGGHHQAARDAVVAGRHKHNAATRRHGAQRCCKRRRVVRHAVTHRAVVQHAHHRRQRGVCHHHWLPQRRRRARCAPASRSRRGVVVSTLAGCAATSRPRWQSPPGAGRQGSSSSCHTRHCHRHGCRCRHRRRRRPPHASHDEGLWKCLQKIRCMKNNY